MIILKTYMMYTLQHSLLG